MSSVAESSRPDAESPWLTLHAARKRAVDETLQRIRAVMEAEVTVDSLARAKAELLALCEQRELFAFAHFPVPDGLTEQTYLLSVDADGGYALYVNSATPVQSYRPHDHGASWAIVAAVHGIERHHLYVAERTADTPGIRAAGIIDVQPGTAVAMLPDGIHAIEAVGGEPLLHLHLYRHRFDDQAERVEYDLERKLSERFKLGNVGGIVDARGAD